MSTASWRCYAAILVCWICYFAIGLTVGYPSTALPDIATGKYGFTLGSTAAKRRNAEAWYGSDFGLANIVGGLGVAPLIDGCGRKMAFLLMAFLTAIGWLLTAAADELVCLFTGRTILGATNGAQVVIVAVIVSELSPKEIRGNATSGNFASLLLGIAMSYVFGTFMNWRWLAVLGVGVLLLATVGGVLLLPETPRWLIVNGHLDIARDNLAKLRSVPASSKEEVSLSTELREMEKSIEEMSTVSLTGALRTLLKPPLLRPLIVCQFTMVFQQLSATGYIKTFLVKIFQMSTGISDAAAADTQSSLLANPHYQAIIIGMCGVVGGLLSIKTTDGLGRRTSLIISSTLVTAALTAMATYFWLHRVDASYASLHLGWLPLSGLVVYNIGYGIGLGPVPYVLMSELFPTRLRSVASSFTFVTHAILFFLVVQIFGGMDIGPEAGFTFYAGVSFIGILFNVFFVPETKGRSLESLEKQFTKDVEL